MRKFNVCLLVCCLALLMFACSGSDTYRGSWKAMDASGAKYEIVFDANNFSVKDSAGKTSSYKYTQNSVHINNSVETYGIKLDDGRGYKVTFPIAADETKGLILSESGEAVYSINRNDYTNPADLYKLN